MIITRLIGGLGNQMFQYAFGKNLAIKNKTELKIDTSVLLDRSQKENIVHRNFDLDIFNIETKFASKHDIKKCNSNNLNYRVLRKINKYSLVLEEYNYNNEKLLQIRNNTLIQGYWQNYKLFSDIDNQIKNDFTLSFNLNNKQKELSEKINNTNSVCVNFRRTDYINIVGTNKLMGELSLKYYEKSINYIAERIDNPYFYIFSDDIEWCKENFKISFPCTFVEHEYAGEKFKIYLQLLSECKHQIIPNSTFAWWGAWLNKNPKKIVISPKQWFTNEEKNSQTVDLIPKTWIRI